MNALYVAQYLSSYEGTITKIQNWEDRSGKRDILTDDLILNDLGKVNSLALDEMNHLLYRGFGKKKIENNGKQKLQNRNYKTEITKTEFKYVISVSIFAPTA